MSKDSDIESTKTANKLLEGKDNLQHAKDPKDGLAELQKGAAQVRHNLKMNNVRLFDLMGEIKDFYECQARESVRAEAFGVTAPLATPSDTSGVV